MKIKIVIGAVVIAAFLLRIYNLAGHDMAGDDVLYSFRSIGYLDYVASTNLQSTPVTWFSERQWWQGLSFHDHPPLVFAIQWLFFKIGGVNLWAARLPFALAGTLSVFFIFLLGRLLFNPIVGLFSAMALAVSNYAVLFSRVGYLDGFLALWIILSIYFFVKAKTNPIHYFWWAVFCATGVMTKYTFGFIAPVFLLWLLLFRRQVFRKRQFYFGLALFFILISPVIVYNVMVWKTRGHFDAAISTMVGQHPDDFKGLIRQTNKSFNIFSATQSMLISNFSVGFLALSLLGLILSFYEICRKRPVAENYAAVLFGLFFSIVILSLVGGGDRFGAILLPFVAFLIGIAASWLLQYFSGRWKKVAIAALALIIIWELAFATQNQYLRYPNEYNQLETYIDAFYKTFGGRPMANLYIKNTQLAEYQEKIIPALSQKRSQLPQHKHLLVYDDRLAWFQSVWIFERRTIYEAMPIHSLSEFLETMQSRGSDFYTRFGLEDAIFIVPTDLVEQNPIIRYRKAIENFIANLENKVDTSDKILRPDGRPLFKIFRVPLI